MIAATALQLDAQRRCLSCCRLVCQLRWKALLRFIALYLLHSFLLMLWTPQLWAFALLVNSLRVPEVIYGMFHNARNLAQELNVMAE